MAANTQNIVMTRGISLKMENNLEFANYVQASLDRFHSNDWGDDIDPEDWKANDSKDNQYALGSYEMGWEKIWIIREYDGSIATVLLPEEH